MTRGILLLNVLLVLLLAAGGYELRNRYLASRQAEAQALGFRPASPNPVKPVADPPSTKLQASNFVEIADRFLFSKDRNPVVVVEKKVEPPPKAMPELPAVYGVMDLGAGPTVFMAYSSAGQQGYRLGEKLGEFTLLAADQKNVTFEWEGKKITRTLDELRSTKEAAPAPSPAPSSSSGNAFSAAAPPPPKPPENVRPAPGPDIGGGQRGCVFGDSSPDGTVIDGYKKVSRNYMTGRICYWEPVK
jgi:hypothetical protein